MQDFRELGVWVKAHRMALDVYRVTDTLPKNEVFGITVQPRRGSGGRADADCGGVWTGGAEFAGQLLKAAAASSELEYLLLLCRDLGYLPEVVYEGLRMDVVTVRKMFSGLIRKL